MTVRFARVQAENLVDELEIVGPEVDVEDVARKLGIEVGYEDLGPGVSGLLVSSPDTAHILVQGSDPPHRQRFTIAHEIGHFVLRHQFEEGKHVHVDRGNFISQRGPQASTGIDPKEVEANQFAACLLMPSKRLTKAAARVAEGGPLFDDHVTRLAEEFNVSEQAMTIRLTKLDLL